VSAKVSRLPKNKPELKIVVSNTPPESPASEPPPEQVEMPFAIVNGEPFTQMPRDLYIPPQAMEVFLEAFEGPLDLLLYLIRRQNLNILDIPLAEITRQYLQMIQREAFRCQRITQKLLDFARGNADACTRHDLTAIVNDVLGVVRHMSRYGDRTIRFTRSTPCYLEINGPEIQQVVMNLVSNGLEAMESGGTMTIAITEQTDQVTLCVTDDGCGMTSEVIDNLFEPFFTQRRNGRGTGLGLSISHRIICDHGGAIEVESPGPGKGSTFRVRLPRRAAKGSVAA